MANLVFTCCFCGQKFELRYANNAEPVVKNGQCCPECNVTKVLPARLELLRKAK